jgi:hypothetical protein
MSVLSFAKYPSPERNTDPLISSFKDHMLTIYTLLLNILPSSFMGRQGGQISEIVLELLQCLRLSRMYGDYCEL